MKIVIKPEVYALLMDISHLTRGREFSGFGFCTHTKDTIEVYDFVMLDIGSEVFTEIPPEVILPLMDRSDAGNMKVWLHKHPLGSGVPGPENWSGTDNNTILNEPLGGIPEAVKWSASIVLTPLGWVGRVDNYITKKTVHCGVEPRSEAAVIVKQVRERKHKASIQTLAVQTANLWSDVELAEYGLTRDEWVEEIIQGLEDGSLLPEDLSFTDWVGLANYGYVNADLLDELEEEDEPYPSYGPVRRRQSHHQPDRSGGHRGGSGARAGKDGRHGRRGVRPR